MLPSATLRRREGLQLSYNLPHRVYDSCVYPRRASNGATIIIYAHEHGLRVIWHGGRRSQSSQRSTRTINGGGIGPIGLQKENEAFEEAEDDEEEEEDIHGSKVFSAKIDIKCNSACTRIAVPASIGETSNCADSPALTSHMIIAIACADLSLQILAISLDPTQQSTTDIQKISIVGAQSHHDIITDVAITFTADVAAGNDAGQRNRSGPRESNDNEAQYAAESPQEWSLLLASVSSTGGGLLLVHRVPIDNSGRVSTDPDDLIPIQRCFMRSTLANSRLSFNSSAYPAERHSHLLITTASNSALKIYQTLAQVKPSQKRRGSTNTINSSVSTAKSLSISPTTGCRPLITLLPDFIVQGPQDISPRRKTIIDARWVLQGRAIIVLQEDGEWGLWDLEAAGPAASSTSNNLVKGQGNVSGIKGGSLTKFAMKGNLGSGLMPMKKSSSASKALPASSLAPMTPHTRKVRADGLFKSGERTQIPTSKTSNPLHGSITLCPQSWLAAGRAKSSDEAVLFSYNSGSVLIPSIQACWRASLGDQGTLDGLGSVRPIGLPALNTACEKQLRAHILPLNGDESTLSTKSTSNSIPSFLVVSASRIAVFIPPSIEKPAHSLVAAPQSTRFNLESSAKPEQALLESGELDIDGMDRILNNMANSAIDQGPLLNGFGKKSVGFHFDDVDDDDDMDVDMGSPSITKSARSKLTVAKSSDGGRRLFT